MSGGDFTQLLKLRCCRFCCRLTRGGGEGNVAALSDSSRLTMWNYGNRESLDNIISNTLGKGINK